MVYKIDPNCKPDNRLRYLWHLTCHPDLRKNLETMRPRRTGKYRGDNEPKNTRFCCATNPGGSFTAIPMEAHRNYYLYRSVEKLKSYRPYEVFDSIATGERWLFEEAEFQLIKKFTPDEIKIIEGLMCKYAFCIGSARGKSNHFQKLASKAVYNLLRRKLYI